MPQNRESWEEEARSEYIYAVIAEIEQNPVRKKLFVGLMQMARDQAAIWSEGKDWHYVPDFRIKLLCRLLKIWGIKPLRALLSAYKIRGMSVYRSGDILNGHDMPTTLEEVGGRHGKSASAGNLRAAVFGVSDGLVSNVSLIMGLAGAAVSEQNLILSGLAGGLAGALSMAAGEYISVRSQREMLEHQLDLEREELALYPREEAKELSLIYQARGISADVADQMATQMTQDVEHGLKILAREELGIDPDEMVSPWAAGGFSFLTFLVGSAVPVLPLFFLNLNQALLVSILATALSLILVGMAVGFFSGKTIYWSGLRMFLIGGGAGLISYLIGGLFS